jgi:hypothetical protein
VPTTAPIRSEDAGKEPGADAPVVTPPEVIRNPRGRWVGEKGENSMAKRTSSTAA